MRKSRKTARPSEFGLRGAVLHVGLAVALAASSACVSTPDPIVEGPWATPARGMVVSEHPLATAAGVEILEDGGNAVDAVVATALALAVTYPQAGNLGGGGFAVWVPHDPALEPAVLDFRETAPAELTREHFLDDEGAFVPLKSIATHFGVGVPGTPDGLWKLHAEFGALTFERVARPAVELAREGFPVDAWLAGDLARPQNALRLRRSPMAGSIFYPGGEPLREGELLIQENLAETIERFAQEGPDLFYRGDIAAALVAEMTRGGGVLSRSDLATYQSRWRAPLRGWFRGFEVITVPPPSSGGLILLQVLGILDGFPLDEERSDSMVRAEEMKTTPFAGGVSGRALHWWIEAMRCAFADRAKHLEDPDFHDVPVDELLSPGWIAQRRTTISERANPEISAMPPGWPEDGETTHISVLDHDGNAVSMTTTLNTAFGTGIMVPGAGFLLNNEIDDFAIQEGAANTYGLIGIGINAIEPGKRPLSSMTPAVVRDGGQAVRMVIGAPGGPRIITAVLQVILRTEVYGQTLEEAIRAPRLHQQWSPRRTSIEAGWDPRLLQDLRYRGHELETIAGTMASVQAIFLEVGGEPVGVSDPRRGGAAGAEGGELSTPARPPGSAPAASSTPLPQGTD